MHYYEIILIIKFKYPYKQCVHKLCSLHKFINSDGIHTEYACKIHCLGRSNEIIFTLLAPIFIFMGAGKTYRQKWELFYVRHEEKWSNIPKSVKNRFYMGALALLHIDR